MGGWRRMRGGRVEVKEGGRVEVNEGWEGGGR